MKIVGIDPGKAGALACVNSETLQADVFLMPYVGKEVDVRAVLSFLDEHSPTLVVLERQLGMAGQGRTSIFSIAKAYGELRACAEIHGAPYLTPLPTQWTKKALAGVPGKGKERNVAAARRLFPAVDFTPGRRRKPHDGIADALLLAWFGMKA